MTLQQLFYSITISESGSMNKAAESLFISQPTLTKSIKELESELGFSIFIRSGKGIELTNDGRDFIIYAKQVFQQYEILKDKFDSSNRRSAMLIEEEAIELGQYLKGLFMVYLFAILGAVPTVISSLKQQKTKYTVQKLN